MPHGGFISRAIADFRRLYGDTVADWIENEDGERYMTEASSFEKFTNDAGADYSLATDGWVTPFPDRPSLLIITAFVETDGTNDGVVRAYIDESGGTTEDYNRIVAQAPKELGAGANDHDMTPIFLPAGSSIDVRNISDPNGANAIDHDDPQTTIHPL